MLRIKNLETRTQEIILLLVGMLSFSILASSFLYLFVSQNVIYSLTGNTGTQILNYLFTYFGYATFLLPFSVYFIGEFVLLHVSNPEDLIKILKKIIFHTFIQLFNIVIGSSFLTIIQAYFRFAVDKGITRGAGGQFGIWVGGELYLHIGILGSSLLLLFSLLTLGIISGKITLISILLYLVDITKYAAKEIKLFSVTSYKFILARLGINEESIADGMIEFESATGHYVSVHRPPVFTHHHIEKEMFTEPLENSEKIIELPPIVQNAPIKTSEPIKKVKQKNSAAERELDERNNTNASEDSQNERKENAQEKQNHGEPNSTSNEILVQPYTKRYSKPDESSLKKPNKLHTPSQKELETQAKELEGRLESFKLPGKVVATHTGYRLTMYEFQPNAGVKLSKIASLSSDLALLLGADSIRILTPIPGKTTVGIEVPNTAPTSLLFSDLIKPLEKAAKIKELPIALGKNVYNDVVLGNIAEMPHLLISGTTGSGKSVFVNTLINSLIFTKSPKELRFLMVDPKMIELSPYNGIPHLLKPVVTDVVEAKNLLVWAEQEMDRRYKQFGDTGSRNIVSFNETIEKGSKATLERKAGKKFDWEWNELPYIVIVIDELADLMITQGKEVEIPITRIAQKARAAGIHLVIATQRPSAEIVTGLIKTNFPTRIAFKVSSAIDSRTILDTSGAEKLLGNGDMLYMPNGKSIERIQASFLSEEEVKKIVRLISEE